MKDYVRDDVPILVNVRRPLAVIASTSVDCATMAKKLIR